MFACLLTCSLFTTWAQSQHPDLPFEHLNIPGTINSSQVNDLIQDHRGIIWIAGNGLYRYDGYRFTVYKNISDSLTIAGAEIICLFSDSVNQRLLLGTHSFGIVSFNYITEEFKVLHSKDGRPIISHLAQTKNGTIWGSSFTNGIFYLENDTLKKFAPAQQRFSRNSTIIAHNNTLLAGSDSKVYTINEQHEIDSISLETPEYPVLPNTRVTALAIDKNNQLWIGTEQSGLFVYDKTENKISKHFSREVSPFHRRINKIMEDANRRIWILTKGEGLAIYSPETRNFIHVVKNPLSERSLSGNNCTSIFQDFNDIIWIGATGDLNKYDPSKIKFRHIYKNPFAFVSLSDNMVRGVYETSDKKLWVGTDGGVIHIFDENRLSVKKIDIHIDGKKHVTPLYFLELPDRTLLVCTSEGLLQYNRSRNTIDYYKPLETHTKGKQIRQAYVYKNKLFYITYGRLYAYDYTSRQVKEYTNVNEPDSLKNVTVLYEDSQQRLWIGSKLGISLLDTLTNTFNLTATIQHTNRQMGAYFMVLSIMEYQGKLWIGSFNDGLWIVDLSDISTTPRILKRKEIQNSTIYATLPDGEGNLWMSTNQGIIRYHVLTGKFANFTVAEGLQHDEFNRLAYTLCANGDIVFGGINGLNIFNPKKITIAEEDYTPHLLGISAFDKNRNAWFPVEADSTATVSLAHHQNDVDISFYVPNYRNPRRFDAYYRLEGYNTDWIYTDLNTVRYANLQPGTHTFQLKIVSGTGIEKIATFTFMIHAPFWQTWWFIALAAFSTCLIVVTIIQASLHNSKKDKERLEALLTVRTQEIEKSREQLATLNEKKDLIFSILSHDLRSPLTTLKGFLSILIDDNELSKEDVKKHAGNIRNSVTSSLDLIDNTLFWSLSQTGNISYTPSMFSLNELLHKVSSLYQLMVERKRINFTVNISEETILYADENMTYVALRNLVSNALKFTPQGKSVTVTVSTSNNKAAHIVVTDEGIGMSAAYLEKLFTEEQLPLIKGTNDEKGTGIGLILCRNFIQLNRGKLSATSVEGQGSRFEVELPLAHI